MKRVAGFLLVAALLTLSVVLGLAARKQKGGFVPYTVTQTVTTYGTSGNVLKSFTQTRAVSASGRWRELREYADGRRGMMFSEPGRGVFEVKGDELAFVSDARTEPRRLTLEDYRKSPQYVRDDTVLGIPVAVLRDAPAQPGAPISESYVAPSLNGDSIKIVVTFSPGSDTQHVLVMEPQTIIAGEPPAASLSHPEKPVEDREYQRMHGGAMKNVGIP